MRTLIMSGGPADMGHLVGAGSSVEEECILTGVRNGKREDMMRRTVMKCVLSCTMLASALLSLVACATSTAQKSTPAATASPTETATPTASPGTGVHVYLGVGATLVALDGRTGAKLWTYDTGQHAPKGGVTAILVAGDRVFFRCNDDNSVYAVDATSGGLLWKLGGLAAGDAGLTLDGSTLFVNEASVQAPNVLYAVDSASGRLL
jgi:glucose dehydrogenase